MTEKIYDFAGKKFFDREHFWNLFFSFCGRINRKRYIFGMLILGFCAWLVDLSAVLDLGFLIFLIPIQFCTLSLIAKRFHDLNISGWWSAVVLYQFAIEITQM